MNYSYCYHNKPEAALTTENIRTVSGMENGYCYHSIPGVRIGSGINYSYCYQSKPGVTIIMV